MRRDQDITPRTHAGTALSTGAFVVAIVGFAALVGYVTLGLFGVIAAVIVSLLFAGAGGLPSSIVMRWQGAAPLAPWQAPHLHRTIDRLSRRAGVDIPAIYLIPSPEANAMATGRAGRDPAVAITHGLLYLLDSDELEGVLAHEIAHLRNNDTTLRQLAGTVGQAAITLLQMAVWMTFFVAVLGEGTALSRLLELALLSMVVPPVMTSLVAALSRTREFAADATAAALTGKPRALAAALARLERQQRSWVRWLFGRPSAPPALRSHPATAERVARLLALEGASRRAEDGGNIWSRPTWVQTGPRG